jgi:hypothetical protein
VLQKRDINTMVRIAKRVMIASLPD